MSQIHPRGAMRPHGHARPPRREDCPDLEPCPYTHASQWPYWTGAAHIEDDVDASEWGPWADRVPFTIEGLTQDDGAELPLFDRGRAS